MTMSATKSLLRHTLSPGAFETLRHVYRPIKAMRFLYVKHIAGYDVPSVPWFDEASTEFYSDHIKTSRIYLEYGSGGSTMQAAQHVDVLVSVDSDPYFVRAVKRKLGRESVKADYRLIYSDIGRTGEWGIPVQREKSKADLAKWRKYPQSPWIYFREKGIEPDTILIDGRFRVACALESLKNLSPDANTLLLFDDYMNRAHYHEIEKFADRVATKGRMGVFRRKLNFDRRLCEAALDIYRDDWR
jgi:hypothetical protein